MNEPMYATKQEVTELKQATFRRQTTNLVLSIVTVVVITISGFANYRTVKNQRSTIETLREQINTEHSIVQQMKQQGLLPADAKDVRIELEFDD